MQTSARDAVLYCTSVPEPPREGTKQATTGDSRLPYPTAFRCQSDATTEAVVSLYDLDVIIIPLIILGGNKADGLKALAAAEAVAVAGGVERGCALRTSRAEECLIAGATGTKRKMVNSNSTSMIQDVSGGTERERET